MAEARALEAELRAAQRLNHDYSNGAVATHEEIAVLELAVGVPIAPLSPLGSFVERLERIRHAVIAERGRLRLAVELLDGLVESACSRLEGELPADETTRRYRQGVMDIQTIQRRATEIKQAAGGK